MRTTDKVLIIRKLQAPVSNKDFFAEQRELEYADEVEEFMNNANDRLTARISKSGVRK